MSWTWNCPDNDGNCKIFYNAHTLWLLSSVTVLILTLGSAWKSYMHQDSAMININSLTHWVPVLHGTSSFLSLWERNVVRLSHRKWNFLYFMQHDMQLFLHKNFLYISSITLYKQIMISLYSIYLFDISLYVWLICFAFPYTYSITLPDTAV